MWSYLLFVLGTALTVQAQNEGESMVVQIAQGQVRGYKEANYDVFAFYDIPYATVTERFKAPITSLKWNDTFEAVERGIICPQMILSDDTANKIMQEDCLVANVFIPSTGERNLPVMVNIHGGAFEIGYGTAETHRTFVQNEKIVVVSFNYRLGALGFLCMGTKDAPGNAGLKDQLALLRWVKENIASFGGNPDDVTISGCSAGSASVDILTLSNSTKGLFSKAISGSGAHLAVFSVQMDPLQYAKDAAKMLNFENVDDLVALQEFYKNAPVDLLVSTAFANNKNGGALFSPCVENDLEEEAILLDAPYNILKRGDNVRYPTMYSFTDLEGELRLMLFPLWSSQMNEKFSDFLPGNLLFQTEEQREEIAKSVKQFYFNDQPVGEATVLSYIDYFSDIMFVYGMMNSIKLNAATGNSTYYLHEYSFVDENSMIIPFINVTAGAYHCAQAVAVQDEDENSITEEYRNMKRIMRKLWGNFIKTGIPVPENSTLPSWPTASADRSPHLSLGTTIELKGIPVEERTRFWDDIYEKYYQAPISPSTDSASVVRSVYLIYLLIISYLLS